MDMCDEVERVTNVRCPIRLHCVCEELQELVAFP